jgi:cytochrome oxidase Cu insertion factor (SCO1/SenC/PrrC family)
MRNATLRKCSLNTSAISVRAFSSLTGTPAQIRAAADACKAYYSRYAPPDGGVNLIDRIGFIYLMGRSGEYLGFFAPGTVADRMVEIITRHLGQHE